jgi:small-conductance mechanosensitive channel
MGGLDMNWYESLPDWFTEPFIRIGHTPISFAWLVQIAAIIVLAWWVAKKVEHGLQHLADRMVDKSDPGSSAGAYAFSRVARYFVWVFATIIGLSWLGFDLTNLAILGGAIGVGLGIGLQGFFGNLFAGVVILFERSVKVGDFVDLQSGVMGRVSEISMRYTRITTNDSVDMFVPNSELTGGRVINWSYGTQIRRIHVPFGVAYGSDKETVRDAGIAAARSVDGTIFDAGRVPEVWLTGFGDSSLNFELVVWVSRELLLSPSRTQAKYLWALETELAERGLQIPFPQRDIHLKTGALRIDGPGTAGSIRVEER